MTIKMKTPISYYGGKQNMLRHILPLIPEHDLYNEPFFGGGALFWAKEPVKVEVINDANGEVINFYRVVQADYHKLNALIQTTLHSREQYQDALHVYARPHMFDEIRRAWAFWILCNQGFGSKIGTWGYDREANSLAKKLEGGKKRFTTDLRDRLSRTQIECNDANTVIKSRDRKGAFHYVDPPYFNSNCGHYGGYTEEDFNELLITLQNCKGMFLLSSYDSEILTRYAKANGWKQIKIEKPLAVTQRAEKKMKTEVLTFNYDHTR